MLAKVVAIVLLLVSSAYGQIRAVIDGPTEIEVGDIAILSATNSTANSLTWVVFPLEKQFYEDSSGRTVCIPGKVPGESIIAVLIAVDLDENQRPVIDTERHPVRVKGKLPPPDDPDSDSDGVRDLLDKCPNTPLGTRVDMNGCPLVKPGPVDPVFPHGTYGFAEMAYHLAVHGNPDAEIPIQPIPAAARIKGPALGANFSAVASAMAAGVYPTLSAALEDSTARNRATLGADRDAWLPWFTSFQTELGKIYDAGGRMSEFAEAYREIATGLKAVPAS